MENQPPPSSQQSPEFNYHSLVLTFCAVSAFLIFLIYSADIIFGSEAGNWIYPYFDKKAIFHIWILIAVIVLLGFSIFLGAKLISTHEKIVLAGLFFVAVSIQVAIRQQYPISMGVIISNDNANSFYSPAMRYSPIEILSQYDSLAETLTGHAKSNMPGKILLFQFLGLFTKSPNTLGILIILLSTTGALLLYGICLKLFHDRQTAFYAFILYILIPSKLFFFPILNTVTPVFILLCLYLFLGYLERKKYIYLWLLGVALYFLVLFEPSPLVTGLIFIGILLNAIGGKRFSKRDFVALLVIPALSFVGVFLLFYGLFSFNIFAALQFVFKDARQFNIDYQRSYQIWIRENPKEFFYGIGLPIGMIFIYLTFQLFSQVKTSKFILTRWSMDSLIILSILLTLLFLNFTGINRGEVTRLWIYFAVFFQIPAAFFLAKTVKSYAVFFLVVCTLAFQAILTLQRVGFVIL